MTVGTSERGTSVDDVSKLIKNCNISEADEVSNDKFKHLLVVFGGVKGLEVALEADPDLKELVDPSALFDIYLNTCPKQGSRTIRTEEAILVSMAALRPKIEEAQK